MLHRHRERMATIATSHTLLMLPSRMALCKDSDGIPRSLPAKCTICLHCVCQGSPASSSNKDGRGLEGETACTKRRLAQTPE